MSNAISAQHPAVVLRSSYRLVQTLLAAATIAVVGLTVAVVLLALNSSNSTTATAAPAIRPAVATQPAVRPNPDQQGATASPAIRPAVATQPAVRPNPDQQAATASPRTVRSPRTNTANSYPGHF
jgi:hypothetical protein